MYALNLKNIKAEVVPPPRLCVLLYPSFLTTVDLFKKVLLHTNGKMPRNRPANAALSHTRR